MDLRHLSPWQRVRRKVSLWGGSYTHPDGHIELDFEGPAGIDGRHDSQEVQEARLDAWERKRSASSAQFQWFIFGAIFGATLMHYRPSLWPF